MTGVASPLLIIVLKSDLAMFKQAGNNHHGLQEKRLRLDSIDQVGVL